MKAEIEIQDLQRLQDHYHTMVEHCSDAIKQLTGYTPDNFKFVFTIDETPIVSIPISEEDGNFCVGVFMSWHQYFSRKLRDTAALLNSLSATKIAV